MGQSMCSVTTGELTQTLNQLAFDDLQMPTDQNSDDLYQQASQSRFNFLKTQIIASWNLLQQKSNQFVDTNYTFATQNHINVSPHQEITQIINNQDIIVQQTSDLPILTEIQNYQIKKQKDFPHQSYQNLEIDVSNFIKIRTENILQFYDFKQKVGQGTFGNVYRCIEKRTGKIRAVKELKKKSMNNKSKMSLIAEIDILKTLDHPNIIKLYDLFLYDGHYYVITQFCEGGCLEKYFLQNKGQISQETIKIIMKQLVSAINYLSTASIVHRDLKMQNIVFLRKITDQSKQFEIKLIDFGTATKIHKHKKTDSGLVGTLMYIAPQFIKGFFTQKCDVWSAGVILYRLLFNEFPFKGRSQKQIINLITTKNIEWNILNKNKISTSAIELLKLMLDKNYLTRASSKTLVQHAWIRQARVQRASKQMAQNAAAALSEYNRKNNFVSVIQSFLSFKKVTQKQRHELAKMFFEIDDDHSGLIQIQQLIQFFKKKYPQYKQQKIVQIVQNVDKNNSGKIDFNEFITAMANKSELFAEQALKQAFEYVDEDKTGYITKKQLKSLLKLADKRQIQQVFQNLDQDGDNQISFQEFRKYLLSM